MYNTTMETIANVTSFNELQTIKKNDLYQLEPANSIVVPSYPNHAFSEPSKLNISEQFTKNEYCERSGNASDVNESKANGDENIGKKSVKLKCKGKSSKYRVWNIPSNNKNFRTKRIRTKTTKICPKSTKRDSGRKPKCEYPRMCSGCGHAYKTKQSFWNHKQRCSLLPQNMIRNMAVDKNGVPIEGVPNSSKFVRRKEYICAHCERHYRKKHNLQEHLKNTCRGKPCSKGRLQCWEEGCVQAFYKYVDLVQHVTLKHGKDLQIQKLQFANFSAFNSWKTEESNSKFMYARKITGSKHFSNTKYHYFVCQFNHRNEKKNNNRKTNRRKSVNLVVPNYNCPSRIMVKECDNQIQVTYISSHNHELNLSNVKYQPLEKETRAYIKTLLQLGVSAKKIVQHLQEGVGNPEIDSFLSTKQQLLTLNRIKRMESKLKAKNRARHLEEITKQEEAIESMEDISFPPCEDIEPSLAPTNSCPPKATSPKNDPNEVVKSIETNLKKLKGYMHKSSVKEKLQDRISKMIQELCDECEHVESTGRKPAQKKRQSQITRKRNPHQQFHLSPSPVQPQIQHQLQSSTHVQQIIVKQPPSRSLQSHIFLQTPIAVVDQNRVMTSVVNNIATSDKSFSPIIYEDADLLKPVYQPFNVNLLCLKSLDPHIPERELVLLSRVDKHFNVGHLYDAIVDSFLALVCKSITNVLPVRTADTEFVQISQRVPDMWHCLNFQTIDTLFIPCNMLRKQWFLMVFQVKSSELQIVDPTEPFEMVPNCYKKYESSIQCWYSVLQLVFGVSQCNLTFPSHTKHNNASDSGVLICWYVFQYVNKRNLLDNIDTDLFRKYIFNSIINNSALQC